jgi:iron(III) transport system permease protein
MSEGEGAGAVGRRWPLLLAWTIALPPLTAIAALLAAWLAPEAAAWEHLLRYRIRDYLVHTALLGLGVGLTASVLGVGLAWLVCRFEFAGRRWLEVALALPLALPTYIVAFVYVGAFDYAGALATALRALDVELPSPRNLVGASLVLGLVLYPYVYLLCRAVLLGEGMRCYEAARTLGAGPWRAFAAGVFPALVPAWIGGIALALMETFADYGAVSVLGVETLTVGIFRLWQGMFNLAAASQLASILLLVALLLALADHRLRARHRVGAALSTPRVRLTPFRGLLAALPALAVLAFALLIPLAQLTAWAIRHPWPIPKLMPVVLDTLAIGFGAALLITLLALALAVAERRGGATRGLRLAGFVAGLGYAVPGAVLAVALLAALASVQRHLGLEPAVYGSLLLLLLVLAIRFLKVGHAPVSAGLARIRPSLSEAAKVLGAGPVHRALRVHLPLLAQSLGAALLLTAVEVMKELPATLLLRPFGFDTLAVRVFAHTAEGMWAEAAFPGLLLILIALPPAWWLVRGR